MLGATNRLQQNIYHDNESPAPAVLAGARAAMIRASWRSERMAHWVRLDPVLCARLLAAWTRATDGKAAFVSLPGCLAQLGRPLLHGLLYGFPGASTGDKNAPETWRQALKTAAVARRLALATGYQKPEEAYLAALLRHLDADAVASTGLGPFVVDAARFCQLPMTDLASAHPLVGIVGVAAWAVDQAEPWPTIEETTAAAALVGLRRDAFAAEVTQGRNWARRIATRLRRSGPPLLEDSAAPDRMAIGGRLQPLQESWLFLDSETELRTSIVNSARILFDCADALLLVPDADSRRLRISADGASRPAVDEMAVDLNLMRSAVVSAFHSAKVSVAVSAEAVDGLPVADRQVAGLLGGKGMLCVPLPTADDKPVALLVFGQQGGSGPLADEPAVARFAEFAGAALLACRLRRERQRQLSDEQREAFQHHARHVSHEAGNILAVIKNYLAVLQEQAEPGQAVGGGFKIVNEEVDRVAGILQELFRPTPAAGGAPVDLNQFIRDTLSRFGVAIFAASHIETALALDASMPTITTDAFALRQVLLNLWRNSAEAMVQGGQLLLSTTARVNWAGRLFAEIAVRDSGPGINAERLAKVFHPVVSDKEAGHEGLGLSIVKASVARLGGEVFCRNARNGGAEFFILIPWQPPTAAPELVVQKSSGDT